MRPSRFLKGLSNWTPQFCSAYDLLGRTYHSIGDSQESKATLRGPLS